MITAHLPCCPVLKERIAITLLRWIVKFAGWEYREITGGAE
jgi:hypothetical protein